MSEAVLTAGETGTHCRSSLWPLRVSGLCLELGQTRLLQDIEFDLGPLGCTAIMGPNGAGKSLLLRVLHGLQSPTSGSIDWGQLSVGLARARQAMVFQRPVLLRRTVASNVDFVLRARGKSRDRVGPLLQHVGLADKAKQPARLLSGGEAQRLALARALATDPDVLMLDEPTASLDPTSVLAIEKIVAGARATGTRIIIVTHDIGQARRLADDVLFLQGGRVVEHTPAASFFDGPHSRAALDFLNGKLHV